jgi:hypothetical protein
MEQNKEKKWYDNKLVVTLLCIVFFPVGLYALWKSNTISKGWKVGVTIVIALFVVIGVSNKDDSVSSTDTISANSQPDKDSTDSTNPTNSKPSTNEEISPNIQSELTNFTVDKANSQFVFTLKAENIESKNEIIYVVVYGKNDNFSPPRRGAWPMAGLLFQQAGTSRGNISTSDISNNWNSRPEITKGFKMNLKSNSKKSIEGALPINKISQKKAWQGELLNPNSIYNEIHLWIFSQDGKLISKQEYNVN